MVYWGVINIIDYYILFRLGGIGNGVVSVIGDCV